MADIFCQSDQVRGGTWLAVNASWRKKLANSLHMPAPVETIVSLHALLRPSLASFCLSPSPFPACYLPVTCLLRRLWIPRRIPPRAVRSNRLLPPTCCVRIDSFLPVLIPLCPLSFRRLEKLLLFTDSTFLVFLELERRLYATRVAAESFPWCTSCLQTLCEV